MKMSMTGRLVATAFAVAMCAPGWSAAPITGDWCFENGDLSTSVGIAMEYLDGASGATAAQTQFGKASSFSLPLPGGVDATVMKFAKCTPSMGYKLFPNTTASGGADTNSYSVMMDIYLPEMPGGYGALMQTSPSNGNDADLFVHSGGGIGIAGQYDGTIKPATWHRVAWTMTAGTLKKYVDGQLVGTQATGSADGRYSWVVGSNIVMFGDEDNETMSGYVARIQVRDGMLSDAEVASLGALYTAAPEVLTAPYLQDMRTDSMTIMWETSVDCAASVSYGTTAAYGNTVAAMQTQTPGGTTVHKAVISGLAAGTTYHYNVTNTGVGTPTADATFKTAPDAETGDFSFGFWSDSQGSTSAGVNEPTVSIMKHMAASGVEFAVTSGDLAEDGNGSASVRPYFLNRVCKYLGNVVPFFIAWGNHDTMSLPAASTGGLNFIRYFASLPSKDRADRPGQTNAGRGSYTFTYRGVFFVFIDNGHSDDITNGWLDGQLATPACKNARLRIAVIHVPPYCEMWLDGDAGLRTNLVPKLEAAKFVACLSGHTHEYERGYLNGVNYLVAGGSSWLDLSEPIVMNWPHMTVGGAQNMEGAPRAGLMHNYVKFDMTGNTLTGTMHTFSVDGAYTGVKDTFSIPVPTAGIADWSLM